MDNTKHPSYERIAKLVGRIQTAHGRDADGEELEQAPVRYVIYARKSTKDGKVDKSTGKQPDSIPQQIAECNRLARALNIRVRDIIPETESAKTSDNRPKFRQMLDDIKAKKFDGIITWAPDRLSRNMKEGGEIVDMLDHGDIKDIKFANGFTYTNNDSGKMLLGIAFVMAKQYVDQQSQNISRSIKNKTRSGHWLGTKTKYGYYLDKHRNFHPDGRNFELVCEAFQRRLAKQSLLEIANFLISEGFPVVTTNTRLRKVKISQKFVSDLLRDPCYAGIMIFGDHVQNLFDHYNFTPAITPEELDLLYTIEGIKKDFRLAEAIKRPGVIKADLIRHMVICGYCNHPMIAGLTTKTTKNGKKNYFYYECRKLGCKKEAIRAKVIIDAACDFLDRQSLANEKSYEHYVAEMKRLFLIRSEKLQQEMKSLKAKRQYADERIADMLELARETKDGDKALRLEYQRDHKQQLAELKQINKDIAKRKNEIATGDDSILAFQEFLELFNNLAKVIRNTKRMEMLDFLLKKLFSNFVIKDGKVLQITQNSPFRELCLDTDSVMVTPRGIEPRLKA